MDIYTKLWAVIIGVAIFGLVLIYIRDRQEKRGKR